MFGWLKWRKAAARFGRARSGATAVEFGLVAAPFFFLMIGLAEVSLAGFAQTSLDFAVSETGRNIRTGRTQTENISHAEVKQALCSNTGAFVVIDCNANLFLDVQRYTSYQQAANFANPIVNGEFQPGAFGFTPGGPSDIVVVRAYYRWHVITPMFQYLFANSAGGDRILSSTMMFRNEPYQ